MSLVRLQGIRVGFGGPNLLDGVDLRIEAGERVGLIGRNGTGKSTLMKLLAGELAADDGELERRQGLVVARLTQEVPAGRGGKVFDLVADGLGQLAPLLREFHDLSHGLDDARDGALLARFEDVQHRLEAAGGWRINQRVESVLSRLGLDPDTDFDTLSGGLKRRVLLARALVREPDLLLLDEPTNHLDIESIGWLEEFLLGYKGTLLFVTHDRMLIRRLATRIVELDRGRLLDWPGDYDAYLRRRQAALEAESRQQAKFDKKLAQEEVWIRQGIKARRTRDEGRVRALQALREERRVRREQPGTARMRLQDAEASGKRVIEARDITYRYADSPIIRDLSLDILRGDRIGVIGPNGCGKTTLLNILLGGLAPDSGRVRFGTRLQVAYFDQHRAQLDEDKSVLDNVAEGRESVTVNGTDKHVIGYLQDFLFTPERARTPVKALSGGERNRLLLARLFAEPANVLVMDEPTNDLDAETLELLEDLLVAYTGTLLLVSHDRTFLNNVVTSTLVFEGGGRVAEYVGGYDDWLRQRQPAKAAPARVRPEKAPAPERRPPPATKLSYKDKRELEALPALIERLENELADLHRRMADPAFYRDSGDGVAATTTRLEQVESELAAAYARWEALEALAP